MYLIALSGGTTAERTEIAERLLVAAKGRLTLCAQAEVTGKGGNWDNQLEGRQAVARAHLLSESLKGLDGACMQHHGFVVAHCLTEQEAQVVREQKGAVWHLYGKPSARVPIRLGDPIVARTGGSFAHVIEPIEALSEYLLSVGRAKRREAC